MLWIVLLASGPLLKWLFKRKPVSDVSDTRAVVVSRNRKTGPTWEQPTPWVLDLDSEEDL